MKPRIVLKKVYSRLLQKSNPIHRAHILNNLPSNPNRA